MFLGPNFTISGNQNLALGLDNNYWFQQVPNCDLLKMPRKNKTYAPKCWFNGVLPFYNL